MLEGDIHDYEFDDIDIAMMTHTAGKQKGIKFEVGGTFNGMIAKLISFKGVASHAGSAPYLGVNALYASNIALSAINAQRETFREEDTIRIHPIITRGGEAVSAIPDDVGIETFIRGKTIDAIISASKKVDRSSLSYICINKIFRKKWTPKKPKRFG